jgi:hypothetical protein
MTNYRALERSLVILPKISGSLSCIGSALIARHIAAKNIKEVSLASKILFGISIVDIIDSFFAYVLGSWMAPRGTLTFAVGNFTSCGVQGFVHVFGIVYLATAYTELSIVYWLMVQRWFKQNRLKQKKFTLRCILPPIFVALFAAIIQVPFDFYNPLLFNCFVNGYPINCDNDIGVECIRGKKALISQSVIFGYVLVGNLIICVFISLLVLTVYRQEKKCDTYLSNGQLPNRKNTIATVWQGIRYTNAYFLTYFALYVVLGYDLVGDKGENMTQAGSYTLEIFYAIFTPLLGFFNSIVYFYPRYNTKRQQQPDLSRMACLVQVLGFDGLLKRISCCKMGTGEGVTAESTPQSYPEDSQSKQGDEEEKEEERPDEECVNQSKVTSVVANEGSAAD